MSSVTFIHGSNDLYGASAVLRDDARIVRSLGYDVTVVVPHEGPLSQALATSGIEVVVKPLRVLRRVDPSSAFLIPADIPVDIPKGSTVVIWTLALIPYLPALRIRGANVILSVHEIQSGLAGSVLARISSTVQLTMANSNATARWLMSHGCSSERVRMAYPAAPSYSPISPRRRDGMLKVLLAGRVNGTKGHLEAVEAVEMLRQRGLEVVLTLAGAPFEGQESHLNVLQRRIAQLPWVDYRGEVDQMRQLIGEHDVMVSATNRPEPFGIVALEAWSAGRRFVGPDEGGMAEAARLVDGLVFTPRRTTSLCAALGVVAQSELLRRIPSAGAPASFLCTLERRRELWIRTLADIGND